MADFIDAHIHVWPESGERARPSRYTAADHLALARLAGVARTVLIQPGMFGFDNRYMLETLAAYPGVFSAVAVVDADSESLGETVAALHGKGARGFRITANPQKPWADWAGMQRLWQLAGARRMAVCPLINPNAFAWVAALCQRHRETPVVIDHLGRIGATGRIEDADVRALCGLARFPAVHVKVSAFYALGAKAAPYLDLAPLIRQVLETYGPRRLMWGSDAPYQAQPPHTYRASLDLLARLRFLNSDDRQWLRRRTAEGLFFAL
jgi:predicted TIM-barrel fold metal-dependent hydrolase